MEQKWILEAIVRHEKELANKSFNVQVSAKIKIVMLTQRVNRELLTPQEKAIVERAEQAVR